MRGRLPAGGLNKIIKRAKLQNGLENLSQFGEVWTEMRKYIKCELWACVAFGACGTAAG
jgi:hypothetical protein